MHSNLSFYQLKTDCYQYKLFCVSFMVATKQKTYIKYTKVKKEESRLSL